MSTINADDIIRAASMLANNYPNRNPPQVFDGLRVMISNHLTKREFCGHWISSHRFTIWLSRWLPFSPWARYPMYRHVDLGPIVDRTRGIIYCTPRHYAALCAGRSPS